jgi:hypothetical protein
MLLSLSTEPSTSTQTKTLTALLDFDFATCTHPCHEFLFTGFAAGIGGGIPPEDSFLEAAILSGNFDDTIPETSQTRTSRSGR